MKKLIGNIDNNGKEIVIVKISWDEYEIEINNNYVEAETAVTEIPYTLGKENGEDLKKELSERIKADVELARCYRTNLMEQKDIDTELMQLLEMFEKTTGCIEKEVIKKLLELEEQICKKIIGEQFSVDSDLSKKE